MLLCPSTECYVIAAVVSCPDTNVMSSFLSQPPPAPRNEVYEEVREIIIL